MRVETTCTNLNLPCPHPYPINVRARRALHIYYLLFIIYYLNCPSGAISSPMVHRSQRPGKSQQKNSLTFSVRLYLGALCSGLSRGLTKPHWGFVVGRYEKRPTRPVLVPDGAPFRNIPGNRNKKTPLLSPVNLYLPFNSPGTLPRPKNAPPGRFCPAVR